MANIRKAQGTGSAAIAVSSVAVPSREFQKLLSVTCHFGVAPAAAGSLTVTLNANAGAAYDTLLVTTSMVGVTDYLYQPDRDLFLEGGDVIDVAYANADGRTYGCQITLEGR